MINFEQLEQQTRHWAAEKGLTDYENRFQQCLKMCEEAGEVAGAVLKGQPDNIKGEIGDVLVTLVNVSTAHGLNLTDCLQSAYDKISKRKGALVDGVFVKEQDTAPHKLPQKQRPFKPGDRVVWERNGLQLFGVVRGVSPNPRGLSRAIIVSFDNDREEEFWEDGRWSAYDKEPTLFHVEPATT